jgi:hypothetical protein
MENNKVTQEDIKVITEMMQELMSINGVYLQHWFGNLAVFRDGTRIDCGAQFSGNNVVLILKIIDHKVRDIISYRHEDCGEGALDGKYLIHVRNKAFDICRNAMCDLLQGGVMYRSDMLDNTILPSDISE